MTENRRQFSRISFQTEARLSLPSGESGVEVLDLSLKGALVRSERLLTSEIGSHGTAHKSGPALSPPRRVLIASWRVTISSLAR